MLKFSSPLLVPGPGDRIHQAHDGHDVRQVVPGDDLLQKLHVYGTRRPVVDPVRRVGAVGDDVDRVLAPCRLGPAEAFSLGRPDAAPQVPHDLALGQVLQNLLYYPDAMLNLAYSYSV